MSKLNRVRPYGLQAPIWACILGFEPAASWKIFYIVTEGQERYAERVSGEPSDYAYTKHRKLRQPEAMTRILVVDDVPSNVTVLTWMLMHQGYTVSQR